MKKTVLAFAATLLATGSALASDKTDVLATIHQWVDDFAKSDSKAAIAVCADQTSIIDDIPPHEWQGAGACAKWYGDFDAFAKEGDVTEPLVTLGKTKHLDISGNTAYFVAPASITYKAKGSPVKQAAIWTVALRKSPAGWRITAWAWSDQ